MTASETAGDAAPLRPAVRSHRARPAPSRAVLGFAAGLGGIAFVAAQTVAGLSNAGFHVVVSRLLGPARYGELGCLLAILTVITVPATTLETLLTARVAARVSAGKPLAATRMLARGLAVGACGTIVLALAAPYLAGWLALDSTAPVWWLAAYCVPLCVSVVAWALVCGQRKFAPAGAVAITAVAVRMGTGLLLIWFGFGVAGALAASVCGDGLRALLLIAVARVRRLDAPGARVVDLQLRHAVGSTAAFGVLWTLMGADTVLAHRLFSPVLAGQYAAAAMATRSVLIVTHAVCLMAVPVFATTGPRSAMRALAWTAGMACGAGLLATGALTALGPELIPAVFGPAFRVPRGLLFLLGITATGLGVLWVLVQYQLARTGRAAAAVWAGLGVAVGGVALIDVTPNSLALTMSLAVAASLALATRAVLRSAVPTVPTVAVPAVPPGRVPGPEDPGDVELTMVVPYHNPGPLLRPTLLKLIAALRRCGIRFEIVAVADGCTDGSPASIADVDPRLVRRLCLPENRGKGAALQLGLREGRGRHLGFIDADGDLDPDDLLAFVALLKLYDPDAVIGAKYHPLSRVEAGFVGRRRVYSMGYRGLVRLLFPRLPVTDTQVGIKVFSRRLLDDVLPHTTERGFVFDLEVLALANRMGYRRVLPAPVTLRRRGPSTVCAGTVWRMFAATVVLAWRVHTGGADRKPAATRPVPALTGQSHLAMVPVPAVPTGGIAEV